jgi:3'-phosphoadenosine 5'-phosphosulfate sulfotransferase (PAPS reductase)/FAD synthetase
MHETIAAAHAVIDEAIETYRPVRVFALFSGGHDSLTATHVASSHPAFAGAVHINTGIGVEQTREFVRETCREQGWPLQEFHPPVGYEEIVLRWGFPGPGGHNLIYNRLKERCIRQLVRETKATAGVLMKRPMVGLVTGVRSAESTRRMRHVDRIQKEGARVWIAPVHDWAKADCNEHIAREGLERNPVVDMLHMSGECLCGAFARPGEMEELELWVPETAARIRRLERLVLERGTEEAKLAWRWGVRPPNVSPAQVSLDVEGAGMLCQGCSSFFTLSGATQS